MTTATEGTETTATTADLAAAPAPATAPIEGAVTTAATPPAAPGASAESTPPAAPGRPDGISDAFWDAQANAPKWADIQAGLAKAAELEAAATARAAEVPTTADAYAPTFTEPLNDLDGKAIEFDRADPAYKAFAEVAHKNGMTQAAFTGALRTYAESQLGQAKQIREALHAEAVALGDNAKGRVDAVSNFIRAHAGEDANAALQSLGTAGAVRAWETVMAKFGQGAVTTPAMAGAVQKSFADRWFPNSNMSRKPA